MSYSYDPWAHAGQLQIPVEYAELQPGMLGYFQSGMIVLDPRQSVRQMTCTLAHELVHAELGDAPVPSGHPDAVRVRRRRERLANRISARRLISLDDLARALRWATDEHEVATELGVDVATVVCRLDLLGDDEKSYIEAQLNLTDLEIA
jgi:Zn-dependent peptidase ImmA (M78 family)